MTQRIERALWTSTLILLLTAGWRYGRATVSEASATPAQARVAAQAAASEASPSSWAAQFASRDPFRLARRPASVRFGEMPPPVQARAPRPVLSLLGIIGGPPWQAAIGGLPEQQGPVVVQPGQQIGRFLVRHVNRDTAVIEGMDTTWVLVTERPR